MPIDVKNDSLQTAMNKLKAREDSFKQLESISNLGSWEIDLIEGTSIWSEQSFKIYGLNEETTKPTLELFLSHVVPEDLQKVKEKLHEVTTTGRVASLECKIKRSDGEIQHLLLNGKALYDENSNPIKLLGTTQNITELESLKRHSNELSNLLEFSSNEIYILNYETLEYLYANKGGCSALGYSLEELLKLTVFDTNPYLTQEEVDLLKLAYKKQGSVLNRSMHKRKDGTLYHVQAFIHQFTYHGVDSFVIFDTDISQTVELEKKLNYQANYDTLTSLPNRTLFKDRLSQSIASSRRNHEEFALLFIDLDQFKDINDSLGHHVGDEVLVIATKRLSKVLREEDTLARLGGDEFTIILKNTKNIEGISTVADKIIKTLKEPIEIHNNTLYISASVGISMYPKDASNEYDLIKFADSAMYKAKDEGRDNFQFYSMHMTTSAITKVIMESNLRSAIKENQFLVYYQPQYNATNNSIIGMEALVRWEHPKLGFIYPDQFLSIAENTGLIIAIDKIVMKKAMQQFSQWYKDGLNPGILALNLGMKQLNEKEFIPNMMKNMSELNFKSEWLELEVTENQVMENPEESIKKLKNISSLGIEIAIDDFGTGYSSLAYLKKLPLNKLKIDRSFISDAVESEDDAVIIKAIIGLAKNLNLSIIAEGVETKEQKDFLLENECNYIQGYFYSKPKPEDEITEFLKTFNT